jgi:HEPN domain-containing protein
MKPLSQLKLTDKEIELIINALKDRIRYKGVRQLLSNINNQLQEQGEVEQIKRSELTDTE